MAILQRYGAMTDEQIAQAYRVLYGPVTTETLAGHRRLLQDQGIVYRTAGRYALAPELS